MQSYKNTKVEDIDETVVNTYTCDNFDNGNIPIINDGHITQTYELLNAIAH